MNPEPSSLGPNPCTPNQARTRPRSRRTLWQASRYPAPSSLTLTLPSTPNPQPSTLHAPPSTLSPQPSTLDPQPSTLNPQPSTINPQPSTLNPPSSTLNTQPSTLHPPPSSHNPQPSTQVRVPARGSTPSHLSFTGASSLTADSLRVGTQLTLFLVRRSTFRVEGVGFKCAAPLGLRV